MNEEIKTRWVSALQSGEYKQGTGLLHRDDKFCCLGVLCDLHAKETGNLWEGSEHSSHYLYALVIPPGEVMEWAGLESDAANNLTQMNDTGTSFEQIARVIEIDC